MLEELRGLLTDLWPYFNLIPKAKIPGTSALQTSLY
jgi:hypothetical protein